MVYTNLTALAAMNIQTKEKASINPGVPECLIMEKARFVLF